MNLNFFIARRYIRSKKRSGFISISTWISIIGTFIGAAALIISLSILGGFEEIVIDRFITVDSHLRVYPQGEKGFKDYHSLKKKILNVPGVKGTSPYILGKAMITTEYNNNKVIMLKGIDANSIDTISNLRQKLELGEFDFERRKGELPKILIANLLSEELGLQRGETINVMCPHGMRGFGMSTVPVQKFMVVGYLEIGIAEYDDMLCMISIQDAQRLFRMSGRVSGFELLTDDRNSADQTGRSLQKILGGNIIYKTWFDLHKTLYMSMNMERLGTMVVLSLIIFVAALNIASSLIMMVLEKKREIGILLSIGAPREMIRKIFLWQGLLNGGIGIVLGLVTGFITVWSMKTFKLFKLPQDIYIIENLPVNINGMDFVIVGCVSFVLIVIATMYPAWKAAKLNPVEALRYE